MDDARRNYIFIEQYLVLGKLGELVGTQLLGLDLLDLLGLHDGNNASLGSGDQVRAVEGSNELSLNSLASTTSSREGLEVGGLGVGGSDLVGGTAGSTVAHSNTILSGDNLDVLQKI